MLELRQSPNHGIGVFALTDFNKGDKVVYQYEEYVYQTLTEKELLDLPLAIQQAILDKTIFNKGEPLTFLDLYCVTDFRSYMNHADEPNTDGIYALRDIKAGEEITENYKAMGEPHELTKRHMNWLWT